MRPMDTHMKARMAPPLGLYTIANMCRNIHQVRVENENIESINFNDNPDIVGITVAVDALPRAIEIAKIFRDQGIPVVAGGILITTAPDCIPKNSFDALCIGMAEGTWWNIIRDMEQGKLSERYMCQAHIKGEDIVSPAYDLIHSSKYMYCNIIHTSRGCPFKCDFCYNSSPNRIYIFRPVSEVLRDIRCVKSRHILFVDDNFIGNPQWTMELLGDLKKMHIKWNAAVSANIVDMPELLDQMRDSGCQGLFIGFESINSNSLKNVHKIQNHVETYDRLVEAIHSRDIMINASFVFGLDNDTPDTFKATLDWIVKHKIESVTSHILTPYPGTKLYETMAKSGRLITFDLSSYNTANVVFKPLGMTQKELYDGYLWIYRKVYSWKNIIKRLPASKRLIMPYLMFNVCYRKYGRLTDLLCRLITYKRIGLYGAKASKYLRI